MDLSIYDASRYHQKEIYSFNERLFKLNYFSFMNEELVHQLASFLWSRLHLGNFDYSMTFSSLPLLELHYFTC